MQHDINKIYEVCKLFNDEYSKNVYLTQIINYTFYEDFGKGIMLHLYYSHIWNLYYNIDSQIKEIINDNNEKLFFCDLSSINIPISLYSPYKYGFFADFIIEQYRYKNKIMANTRKKNRIIRHIFFLFLIFHIRKQNIMAIKIIFGHIIS